MSCIKTAVGIRLHQRQIQEQSAAHYQIPKVDGLYDCNIWPSDRMLSTVLHSCDSYHGNREEFYNNVGMEYHICVYLPKLFVEPACVLLEN